MKPEPILTLSAITKSYQKRKILSSISLSIHSGECYLLQGSNGNGKSTLIKIAAGLVAPSSGLRKTADDKNIRIGYAPDHLPPLKLSSTEYLRYMGRIAGMDKNVLAARILELHRLFHLDPGSSAYLLHYSKGMLQKVNLMQASLEKPDLLLLDEPLSGLDPTSQVQLVEALHEIKRQGTAIVAAVHDSFLIEALGGISLRLQDGILSTISSDDSKTDSAARPIGMDVEAEVEIKVKTSSNLLSDLLADYPSARYSSLSSGEFLIHLPMEPSQHLLLALLQNGARVDHYIPTKEE